MARQVRFMDRHTQAPGHIQFLQCDLIQIPRKEPLAVLTALHDPDLVGRIEQVRLEASERVLGVLTPAQRRTLHEMLTVVVGEDQ